MAPLSRFIPTAVTSRPRLSWTVPLLWNGQRQTAAEIRVGRAPLDPRDERTSLLVTTTLASSDPYVVLPCDLPANSEHRWTVRVRCETGTWSDWSRPATIETGPLDASDWVGSWVTHPALHVLRLAFVVDQPVERARLHLTAQGLVRAEIGGVAVNASSSDPSRTDWARALYRSYDVGDLIREGDNHLDLTLARGEWERTGHDPRVLADVVIDLAGGRRQIVGTGEGMLAAPSEVVVEEPFYLERHDRSAPRQRFSPAFRARVLTGRLEPASAIEPPARVDPDPSPPIRAVREFEPAVTVRPGVRVFDVGTNIAGRSRLTVTGALPAGTVIRVVHGEHVGTDGRLDTTNLTMPFDHGRVRQAVEYVAADGRGQVFEPWFLFHGFRFVEVTGLPDEVDATLTAVALHTDLESVGALETDSPVVGTLTERAARTLLNNVHGIPEDCPTREQSGWTGDTASVTEFEFSGFDMEAFFRKWLGDLSTSQGADGAIPAIAPDVREAKTLADPVWGAALHRVLLGHWLHYGDVRVRDEGLPALRRWADFQLGCRDETGVIALAPISYGHDWLALEQTPPPVHHTAATIDCLESLAELEESAGDSASATSRRDQADSLRSSARYAFHDEETGVFGNGSQASYAIAIDAGILADAGADVAAARLESDVRTRGDRVSSGFAATRSVVRALAASGRSDVIFDTLHQSVEPGIGAMLDHGPGTFWECWWIDPENTGTGSLDHVGLGGPFAAWAWQRLAGVRPTAAGYARFTVDPHLVDGVSALTMTTETVRGTVRVSYRRAGDECELELTVPVSAGAVVPMPDGETLVLGAGRHRVSRPWAALARRRDPVDGGDWHAPSVAPMSADVVGTGYLADAITADAVRADHAEISVLDGGLRCMPVPHAQVRGPVLRVVADEPGVAPSVRVDLRPLHSDASPGKDARFGYALIDLCSANPPREIVTRLVFTAGDGTTREGTARVWPAGWNRVTVDLGGWDGRTDIVSVEAGIVFARTDDSSADQIAASFTLGEVGHSDTRRLW